MKRLLFALLVGLLGVATAQAQPWTENLGGGTLAPGASFGGSFTIADPGYVDGMDIEFNITGITGNATWASDMQFAITGPSGSSWIIGGFTNAGAANQGWDFDGSGSTNDGFYSHSINNPFNSNLDGTTNSLGTWNWSMTHDWFTSPATVTISDLTVTLRGQAIPEPTSMVLASIACVGMLVRRRRRT